MFGQQINGPGAAATLILEDQMKRIVTNDARIKHKEKMAGLIPRGNDSPFGDFPSDYKPQRNLMNTIGLARARPKNIERVGPKGPARPDCIPPPIAGAYRRKPIKATEFRRFYDRGDLPIQVTRVALGEALVPYYRQILPIFNIFKNSNIHSKDKMDYGQRKRLVLGDLVEETLEIFEIHGGEDAFINIKANEVKFLQEQHSAAVEALARIEEQRDEARVIIKDYETNQDTVEKEYESDLKDLRELEQEEREQRIQLQQHNENIREAAVTNTNIKDMIKSEEDSLVKLKAEQKGNVAEEIRLEGIADEFRNMKKLNEEQVVFIENESAKVREMLRQTVKEQEQIASAIKNMEAQAKAEMDTLEETLKKEKKRNTELLQQCRHNEVAERRMRQEITEMRRLCDEERKELVRLEAMRDGSAYEHEQYIKEKGDLVRRLELLRDQNEKYSASITEVEANNEKAREKYNEQADKFRDMGDQVGGQDDNGQEEDSSALKQRIAETQRELHKLRQTVSSGIGADNEDAEAELSADIAKLDAEIDFVKRTDMLDENGRMKPIQIESDGSDLVSRLQINEFLYRAQQEPREAVALIIEKLSHLLELIHGAQSQGDQYLGDLDRSNGYMNSLRKKNRELLEDVVTLERFRGRTLLQVITNALSCTGGKKPNLLLRGLGYTVPEVYELIRMLHAADSAEDIELIDLAKNDLNDEAIPLVCEIINMLSYLKQLDVSENYITPEGVGKLAEFIKGMEGVTAIIQDDDKITANSGAQTRIQIRIGDQRFLDETDMKTQRVMGSDLSDHKSGGGPEKAMELLSDADTFLESSEQKHKGEASNELPPIKPPSST
ncbi:hypothetical protein FOL47_000507 [Perkinsus chesapeaki]|uniref:Uncharacterized protein n=1 Tax=Perkinsus chesapeaki TaxID=330153 RepID=A0A7J6MLH5_PERCH|nr:hypothetical protein FOL47_000507 [Perkinsus chesapeaki]